MNNQVFLALVVRISIAVFTRTFFQPDEYFQALEPAHAVVFGYGHITWEWLTDRPIRSIIYPSLNVPLYWLVKVLRLDDAAIGDLLLITGPRLLHGCIAAVTDIWVLLLAKKIAGERYASTAFVLSLLSTFNALSLSRSFSNSLETSLTTVAFSYFPWDSSANLSHVLLFDRKALRKSLAFASLACAVRPTNAVIWVFLYSNLVWQLRTRPRVLGAFLADVASIGSFVLAVQFALDSTYYGRPTFTPLNFFLTNLSSVSSFYGGNPWHFYLSAALPTLGATSLPFVLLGAQSAFKGSKRDTGPLQLASYTIGWTIAIYSLSRHKEWRFIHPILPLLHILAAKWLLDNSDQPSRASGKLKPKLKGAIRSWIRSFPPLRKAHIFILLIQAPISVFLVLDYCSAPISVMSYLRGLPAQDLSRSIGFLMPCHSTPGYAYLHRRELSAGKWWMLGCEPPLRGEALDTYVDQTDVFFQSPIDYLDRYFPSKVDTSFPVSPYPASLPGTKDDQWVHEWPKHLVFFGQLLSYDGVESRLKGLGYHEVWRRGRDWEGEGKRKGGPNVTLASVTLLPRLGLVPLDIRMSSLPRILRYLPGGHRNYSFFSSKSGGGRYFNSAKPPKPSVVAPSANNAQPDSSSNSKASDGATEVREDSASQASSSTVAVQQPDPPQAVLSFHETVHHKLAHHPAVNPKEFKLHQFFALHRPLLHLSDPSMLLQAAPARGPLYASKAGDTDPLPPPPPVGKYGAVFEDNSVFSAEADAETARQLMRALTINRAGSTAAWEETMKGLGLTVEMDSQTLEQMERDWNDVMMDSTKRKRRKKMKKHKLKKRRRATRASRIKIGR
ncbi:glycosylphosphatidylinositol anchor biosynthesis [Pleurotus pulmonarius]|nr:glycosylphosphatidylinositol anchor biosynthesis [Pleurotus pulmonarius]